MKGIEFIEELDNLYISIENDAWLKPRSHKLICDIYESVALIESGGVESFWNCDFNKSRTIKSYVLLGEKRIAKYLKESKKIVKSGDQAQIVEINSQLWTLMGEREIISKLYEYVKENGLI